MRNVLTRTASGIVYIALMVAAVFTQWVAVPLTFFLIVVGIRELYKMYETPELKVRYPFAIVAGLTMALAFLFASQFYLFVRGLPHEPGIRIKIFPYEGVLILLSVVAVFLPELFTRHENPVQNIGNNTVYRIIIDQADTLTEPSCVLLVSNTGIHEPVTHDDFSSFKCRLYKLRDMLSTARRIQQGFGHRCKLFILRIQYYSSDLFTNWCPSRFTCKQSIYAISPHVFLYIFELC